MRSISAIPIAGTITLMIVDVTETLLEGVAGTLVAVVIETVLIVDDGVSAEYVDKVEQFIRNNVSSES